MAELIFYTGPMGSSKTAHALMTNFQYKEKGKNANIKDERQCK